MATHGTAGKLAIWNAALFEVGDARLSDTGEVGTRGTVLTDLWDNVVSDCLTEASWNFAIRSVVAYGDTGIARTDTGGDIYGFTYGYSKPADWVRTYAVSADEHFAQPLENYTDDAGQWYAEEQTLYFRYVSDSGDYGYDLSKWPRNFTRYVELELAHRSLPRLSQSTADKERIFKDLKMAKRNAVSSDAMDEAQPKFPPASSWTRARSSRYGGWRDRGRRNSLTN